MLTQISFGETRVCADLSTFDAQEGNINNAIRLKRRTRVCAFRFACLFFKEICVWCGVVC